MSDEDLKKMLFTLYALRNAIKSNAYNSIHVEMAQEMIDKIESHLGIASVA